MPTYPKVEVGCRLVAEYIDEGEIPPSVVKHGGQPVRPWLVASYDDSAGHSDRNGGPPEPGLSKR